jgi:hypothetical protein
MLDAGMALTKYELQIDGSKAWDRQWLQPFAVDLYPRKRLI